MVRPQEPKLSVRVETGCPTSDSNVADVVNTFPGPPLVPPDPTAGLICRYGPRLGSGLPDSGRLVRSKLLGPDLAKQLVGAIRRVNLAKPSGELLCPSEEGYVTIIGFSYQGRRDVGLWYQSTGCQTLDNGKLGAFQGSNPSFGDFQSVIEALLPRVTP